MLNGHPSFFCLGLIGVRAIYLDPAALWGADVTLYVGVEHLPGLGVQDFHRKVLHIGYQIHPGV